MVRLVPTLGADVPAPVGKAAAVTALDLMLFLGQICNAPGFRFLLQVKDKFLQNFCELLKLLGRNPPWNPRPLSIPPFHIDSLVQKPCISFQSGYRPDWYHFTAEQAVIKNMVWRQDKPIRSVLPGRGITHRSEERRVGKECRL